MAYDAFAQALDVVFRTLGLTATYTPPSGAAVACRVIKRQPERFAGEGAFSAPAIVGDAEIEVRSAEASPVEGGMFAIGAKTYRIDRPPYVEDADGRVWCCYAVEVAA